MPRLGVAGTPFIEDASQPQSHTYAHEFADLEHVSGACQMFRRQCFEEVGGYTPIKGGGIDWVAVTTARMKGWQTRTFVERTCFHHRKMGTAGRQPIDGYDFGTVQEDYYVGGHPLWQVLRGTFQMKNEALSARWLVPDPRVLLGHGKEDAQAGVARTSRVSSGRADGATSKNDFRLALKPDMPIIGSARENSLSSRLAGDLLSVNLLQSEITWTTEPSLLVQRVQSFRCKLSATFRNDFMRDLRDFSGLLEYFRKSFVQLSRYSTWLARRSRQQR